MVEIEFSVMEFTQGFSDHLLPLLEAFEKQYSIHVNLVGIPWDKGWTEIAKFGIYGHGPDVSSIGTTWVGSLASMHALRAFDAADLRALGGTDAFFDVCWQTGFLPDNPTTPWAIPWLADVMVIYYWKDALEKSGILDAPAAFESDEALIETLGKLHKAGYAYPLALTTIPSPVILHEAAHWVWSAGGDFISPDNRQAIFSQPEALAGFRNYFSLLPFLSPDSLSSGSRSNLFDTGEVAVHFAGPYNGTVRRIQNPEWGEHLGIAQAPRTGFVGGSSFVVWQSSRHQREALELVRFLSSQPLHIPISPHDQALPTRRAALDLPTAETDVFHHTFLQALQQGRSFPTLRLWGSVEEKLVFEISNIWADLFANPQQDLDACILQHLDPLAQRLNVMLGN